MFGQLLSVYRGLLHKRYEGLTMSCVTFQVPIVIRLLFAATVLLLEFSMQSRCVPLLLSPSCDWYRVGACLGRTSFRCLGIGVHPPLILSPALLVPLRFLASCWLRGFCFSSICLPHFLLACLTVLLGSGWAGCGILALMSLPP